MKKILSISASTVLLSLSASAAITVVGGTPSYSSTGSGFDYTPSAIGNVLVAGTYSDNPASSITFDGNTAVEDLTDGRSVLSYYVTTDTTEIAIAPVGGSANGMFLYELSGVDTSASVVSSITGTITTPVDNSFVVSLGSANGNNPSVTPTGSIVVGINEQVSGNGGGGLRGGTFTYDTAGSQDVGWTVTGGGTNTPQARLAFSFSPATESIIVPEPSSAALFGLSGLALLLRRRKLAF
ncbi:MAG: PEP-CTERM sorting domain-containing protein [Akkermansiaceae bacterium]